MCKVFFVWESSLVANSPTSLSELGEDDLNAVHKNESVSSSVLQIFVEEFFF